MPDDETALESRLLQNGCVVLYHNPFLMEEHSVLLVRKGWQFKEIFVADTGTSEDFYNQASLMLDFPNYFGRNLNALRDCLSDIAFPESGRLALGLVRFDLVAKYDAEFAQAILGIFAESERHWLMEGKRILFLVQSVIQIYISFLSARQQFSGILRNGWIQSEKRTKHPRRDFVPAVEAKMTPSPQ